MVLQVLPQTLVSPTAGVVNDRVSRKAIMIGADAARSFIVLGMLLVRTRAMVWLVYPLLLLETMAAAFFEPAHSSVVPNIVAPDEVLTANGLASMTWCFCLAVGASLGGVAAALLGRDAVFVLNAISFLGSAWLIGACASRNRTGRQDAPFHVRELLDFTPIVEGLRYIRSDRRLLSTVFVKFGGGLLGANNVVLLPVLGQRVFPVPGREGRQRSRRHPGHEPVDGGTRRGRVNRSAGGGAVGGERSLARMGAGILVGFLCAAAGYLLLGFRQSCRWRFWVSPWRMEVFRRTGCSPQRCCSSAPRTVSAEGSSRPNSDC